MSKKKIVKKTAKTSIKAESCAGCEILILLIFVGTVIAATLYFAGVFDSPENKIEEGQCYIDKSYKPVIVHRTYDSLKEAHLRDAEVHESEYLQGWVLSEVPGTLRLRTFQFIKENYVKVKCYNKG